MQRFSNGTKVDFFLLVKHLHNKQNNTWLLGDMEILFSCSTWYLTHNLVCSLVRTLDEKFHISVHPCIILYLSHNIKFVCYDLVESYLEIAIFIFLTWFSGKNFKNLLMSDSIAQQKNINNFPKHMSLTHSWKKKK